MEFNHISVLLNECIENLKIKPGGIYVDGTLGGAGHARKISETLGQTGRLIGIDRDEDAIEKARAVLAGFAGASLVRGNFSEIKEILLSLGVAAVDGILLDLGVSSYQLDEP
ncbi:MAG: 16S rRNA (cytosine(1402)-N(4))-methyltransferase, partial [Clostridiales bacterium]|nr:16S rRNA (cytosine(1402)-N(4))-methyltransferase [Clostridiales bacterium]